jgi:16S rRNA (guanine966-N2)-methyltransferase
MSYYNRGNSRLFLPRPAGTAHAHNRRPGAGHPPRAAQGRRGPAGDRRAAAGRFLGAYGLEALSRGAAGGVFVERDARTAAFIRQNLAAVCKSLGRDTGGLHVITADATSVALTVVPDLVFIDPPYEVIREVAPKIFARLTVLLQDKPDPLIVFEMPGEIELAPADWTCVKRLGKGGRQPTACIFKASRAVT